VAHALPGRLRVHLPLLKQVPSSEADAVARVARLICAPDAIEHAAPDLRTGNVLIRYDADALTQADVLHYLRGVTELWLTNRAQLAGLTPQRYGAIEERLHEWLRAQVTYRLHLDGHARIPDELLT
jgi:hypothetical protein